MLMVLHVLYQYVMLCVMNACHAHFATFSFYARFAIFFVLRSFCYFFFFFFFFFKKIAFQPQIVLNLSYFFGQFEP